MNLENDWKSFRPLALVFAHIFALGMSYLSLRGCVHTFDRIL
jgi:hypothetical protein